MANPWKIQVLTTDHLVEGWYDPRESDGGSFFLRAWADSDGRIALSAVMRLTSVQSWPTRYAGEAELFGEWTSMSPQVVAVIPRDEASTEHVVKNASAVHEVAGQIFVGPYRIRATILSPDERIGALSYYFNVAVRDAEFSWRRLDGTVQSLRVPWALVRTHLISGIGLDR